MKKSKILFIIISIIFVLVLLFFVVDFSRKTTFPGSFEIREHFDQGGLAEINLNCLHVL